MCMMGDDNGWDVWFGENAHVARKPHKCTECRRVIEPGERYLYGGGVMDGETSTYKTCVDCAEKPRAWLEDNCDGWLYGCLLEDLEEHIDQFPNDVALMEAIWVIRSHGGRRDPELYEAIATREWRLVE